MCGIVGYVGKKQVVLVINGGVRKFESKKLEGAKFLALFREAGSSVAIAEKAAKNSGFGSGICLAMATYHARTIQTRVAASPPRTRPNAPGHATTAALPRPGRGLRC